uniref:Signal recognition particle receptor subunit alpha n=1 Tax=Ascaris suum TaxID=6253 RepID=F1KZQ8_ASCSU
MIDLFTIFGKGGLVLWCFQEGGQLFTDSINELIKEVLMQERGSSTLFKHNNVYIKYKLDNEFELVFLVVYQSAIQLSYGDQLISDVQKKFRDMYKNVLCDNKALYSSSPRTFDNFGEHFQKIYRSARSMNLNRPEKVMRKFEESEKSKKTVASMIERPAERAAKLLKEKEQQQKMLKQQQPTKKSTASKKEKESALIISDEETAKQSATSSPPVRPSSPKSDADDEEMRRKRAEFFKKKGGVATKKGGDSERVPEVKKGKQARVWGLAANGNKADIASLDYSKTDGENGDAPEVEEDRRFMEEQMQFVGRLKGELPGLDEDLSEDEASEEENEEGKSNATKSGGGWFSAFKSLVGNKKLTAEDIQPVLDKMRDTLIAKNVAAEPADKLCQSVAAKLEGKVVGSFSRVAGIVKESIREALVQLLTPKRRVDILRDVLEAKREHRPYVIVFCGVNGVGKSTNLAKITFWLNENGHRVLIAAGDTFRAGAVEQLRTHTKHLNSLHPNSVQLYEQGYGKDPAGLAAAAIAIASERNIDVVLVDTAGRMQDNEPLMRSLAKLIRINEPDLVLFVGEALVGNDAVDQLVKFNQALADHAALGADARLIDGIVLTKFDTIDDKVGAAISMTYITGQPIVFVGTGQTYKDLKNLNISAVVHSLLK